MLTLVTQEALDAADRPALEDVAAFVAAQHAAAQAAGGSSAGSQVPRLPPRSLPAAILDGRGAAHADRARAVDVLAGLLTTGEQVKGPKT